MSPGNMKTAGMGPNCLLFMCGIQTFFFLFACVGRVLLTHTYMLDTSTKKRCFFIALLHFKPQLGQRVCAHIVILIDISIIC